MDRPRSKGFTLIEMLITLTVAGILVGIMVPNMRDFIRNNRLSSAVNDMLHSLQMARTEAIKRQNGNVVWCGTADPNAGNPTCDYLNFTGWFVFQDTNGNWQHDNGEPIIQRHALLDATVTVKTDANDRIVSFSPSGFANPAGARVPVATIVICDSRGVVAYGNTASARARLIAPTRRARTSSSWNDVALTALPLVVGGSCP
jgi:type IV fimbrial biogenesis protein FimT